MGKFQKRTRKYMTNIKRGKKGEEVVFLANPFVIEGQTFLDFLPINSAEGIDRLLENHLVYTHSLVKYDVQRNGEISIKWLDEGKIGDLFKKKKIKIAHEIVGIGINNSKFILTAKPKELQKFIKKFMASKDTEKWESSTSFTLKQMDVTP